MFPRYVQLLFFSIFAYILYTNKHIQLCDRLDYYLEALRLLLLPDSNSNEIITSSGEILFTPNALEKYKNLNKGLYLSILGQVFDVSRGEKYYGPGQNYYSFVGRDGSAAFITGDFTDDGLTDDVSSFTNKQIQSLMGWVEFYKKTYLYKGKLIGRYYTQDGKPTTENYTLKEKIKATQKSEFKEEQEKKNFPPCNVEWTQETGTKVWCTKNSGGIVRNWVGVPRMFYNEPGSKNYRCACVNRNNIQVKTKDGFLKLYSDCHEDSTFCIVQLEN